MSRGGQPVLRIRTDDGWADYGPGDLASTPDGLLLASDVVADWLAEPGRTDEDVELGRRFLALDEFP